MATTTLIYIAVFLTVLLIMGKVIGNYLARLIEGDLPHWVTKQNRLFGVAVVLNLPAKQFSL